MVYRYDDNSVNRDGCSSCRGHVPRILHRGSYWSISSCIISRYRGIIDGCDVSHVGQDGHWTHLRCHQCCCHVCLIRCSLGCRSHGKCTEFYKQPQEFVLGALLRPDLSGPQECSLRPQVRGLREFNGVQVGPRPYMHFGRAKGLENAYSDRKMSFSSCFDSLFGAWQSWTLGVLLPSVPWLRLSSSGPTGDTLLLSLFWLCCWWWWWWWLWACVLLLRCCCWHTDCVVI